MMDFFLEYSAVMFIAAFVLLDLVYGGRAFNSTRYWRLTGLVTTVISLAVSVYTATLWADVFGEFSVLDGAQLGTPGGAAIGVLIYELVHYGYHRFAHWFTPMWRFSHQLHHSAESLDAFGAYFLSPLDVIGFTSCASLVFFPLLGLTAEAGGWAAAFLGLNAAFQHANIKTPRWLGYLIQRPESHQVHHARGLHYFNFSDLPLWDIVFGTFRNPASYEGAVGFYDGASSRIGEMLLGRDVSTPPRPARKTPDETTPPDAVHA